MIFICNEVIQYTNIYVCIILITSSCTVQYYDELGLSPESKRRRINEVSRHRDHHSPPKTPPGFWRVDMPTTAEIEARM